ncbi:MAG TPA: acetylxylan esterase [Bryobacteraceae bacterium]|jgi:cephalosporin-C deacetylase-like acetyl esterase
MAPRLAASLFLCCAVGFAQQEARQDLVRYLDNIADAKLADRQKAVAQIRSRADAEKRQVMVREKILKLIGGLPQRKGPLKVKELGEFDARVFHVKHLAYESQPGFWVTANVYIPEGAGKFPAVLLSPGHEATGKISQYSWGANLAQQGILAMAIDPLGQGERLQYYDAEKKASFIGGSTGEHGEANVPLMLMGEHLASFMVFDAMRGIDYLASRRDVDASRIGALGCSGGGTVTAYLAAFDDRVKVAGAACYITSFHELLPHEGNQEAEQSIPHFIEQGLDFADWVELAAPKPYAVISTMNDMFPFEGARQSVEEAKKFYGLFGAADKLQWITGPGAHGNLGPISPDILAFFTKYLKNDLTAPPFQAVRLEHREDIQTTPTGQVATSLGGETVASLVRKQAAEVLPMKKAIGGHSDLQALQIRLRTDIRELTGAVAKPGSLPPQVDVSPTGIAFESEPGIRVNGQISIPGTPGRKPAVLVIGASSGAVADANSIVMTLEPRPSPAGTEGLKSPYLGVFNLLSLRASLVGKTILGMRVDDTIRALDWLSARDDVDASDIRIYGEGAMGVVALHAAVLDSRIKGVTVKNALASYRMIVDQPVHRGVSEIVVPGVLRRYDLGDLLIALNPRPVEVIDPQDALGAAIAEQDYRKSLAYVFQSEERLGAAQAMKLTITPPAAK